MPQKHLFIIDPLDKLNFELDTSLKIAHELYNLKQDVYISTAEDLHWQGLTKKLEASTQALMFLNPSSSPKALAPKKRLLSTFKSVHFRKEPPIDFNYLYTTYLLEQVEKETKVYNTPHALRTYNEKLLPFLFPEDAIPAFVSYKVPELLRYLKESCKGDGIVKPLHLFGGQKVLRLSTKTLNTSQINQLLKKQTEKQTKPLLIQPFLSDVFAGEVRVFTANGRPISWCLKKPKKGSYLANTSSGADIEEFIPSKRLNNKITQIAVHLLEKGIFFAGFDIIQDKISEINITSPRLLSTKKEISNHFKKIAELLR